MTSRDDHIDVMREFAKAETGREMDPHWTYGRRGFLRSGVGAAAAMSIPFGMLGAGKAHAQQLPYSPDYGPLAPVNDQVTGLPLLQLPEGFKYWSFGWTGDVMSDGVPTPSLHDGMAVVASDADKLVLVRNHEQGSNAPGFASPRLTYDPMANGGTTNLVFAPRQNQFLSSWATLSGTVRNCAGGPTTWNSWITCEESQNFHTKQHGYCFDVPAAGAARPVPLKDMGCFEHEAVAVDPVTGYIYETEDSTPSGFYRFIPKVKGRPEMGGRLQMMKLDAPTNASININGKSYGYFNTGATSVMTGSTWNVNWVDIGNPDAPGAVKQQGLVQGASSLVRGEGLWYGNGVLYVCSTTGGTFSRGQIFAYDPRKETFTLLFTSSGIGQLNQPGFVDMPDNIAWSPRGALVLCEDGGGGTRTQTIHGLTLDGACFPFVHNNLNFTNNNGGFGPVTRPSGVVFNSDARRNEFCGATFHNEWFFFNIQTPGITFAVTGPWDHGAL